MAERARHSGGMLAGPAASIVNILFGAVFAAAVWHFFGERLAISGEASLLFFFFSPGFLPPQPGFLAQKFQIPARSHVEVGPEQPHGRACPLQAGKLPEALRMSG